MHPISLDTLLAANDFHQPEASDFIPHLLPLGLTLLYSPHHSGTSLLTLHLALSVSLGTPALGRLSTTHTSVLYLGLHDTPQRMSIRTRKLLGNTQPPTAFAWTNTLTPSSSSDTDSIATLDHWLTDHPHTRLVIIDSLHDLSPTPSAPLTAQHEYTLLHRLRTLANERRIAILVTCHQPSKAIRTFPDTQPISASLADTLLVLKRTHGQPDATLCIAGNSLPYQELALQLPTETLYWTLLGPAINHRLSQERQDILALLEEHHSAPLTPKYIASLLHKDPRAITKLLFEMSRAGQIRIVDRGKYASLKPDSSLIHSLGNNQINWHDLIKGKVEEQSNNSNNRENKNTEEHSNNGNDRENRNTEEHGNNGNITCSIGAPRGMKMG